MDLPQAWPWSVTGGAWAPSLLREGQHRDRELRSLNVGSRFTSQLLCRLFERGAGSARLG